ncbi:hypothetical protein CVU76_01850 [Candidatus Dojkabacteria bacterium HGW-Dojkabacteria-1]|uniref:VTT domain-containing protein n=1 Tax=Candidatus Dojkabacteria bacterium HGW-Dojkabacteria-1 TaxID=2013761 RepID=A0A2N2F3L7_9BACT|nr:MAG: hypothetical protein CVU76_01850 [Candidatus Dojkabacteria bacterium HGW-Dojkabacteria-1]
MIDFLLTKTVEILVDMGYWGVFLSSLGLFPSEIVIALFSATPDSNIWFTALAASFGALVGGIPTYFIGYIFTEDVLYKWLNGKGKFLHIDTEKIESNKKIVRKRGFIYVYITRLIPWLRIVASIAAGYVKVNLFQYVVAIFLGMFTYTILISFIGLEAGENWELVTDYIKILDRWIIIILVGGTIGYLLYKSKKKIMRKIRQSI